MEPETARPASQPAPTGALKIAVSVAIYGVLVSAIPIYTKCVLNGKFPNGHTADWLKKFPYPLATAAMQLCFVSFLLVVMSIAGHFLSASNRNMPRSWIFGPHFWYKFQYVAPIGFCFGIKYGITNWGLNLVSAGTHLLLQATDLVWTCAAARIINGERLGVFEYTAAMLSTVGSVFIAMHASEKLEASFLGLLVNLLTPLASGLCVSTLRYGTKELFRPDNVLGGTVTPLEFSAWKLMISGAVAAVLAMVMENGQHALEGSGAAAWWVAFPKLPQGSHILLFAGALLMLGHHVNLSWLAGMTSAVTVGIADGVKVVPQWLTSALLKGKVDVGVTNIVGIIMVLGASVLYTWAVNQGYRLMLTLDGFARVPREGHGHGHGGQVADGGQLPLRGIDVEACQSVSKTGRL